MQITSNHDSTADDLVLLEFEASFDLFDPFDPFYDFRDEIEYPPHETTWCYRVPFPGVKYYAFE